MAEALRCRDCGRPVLTSTVGVALRDLPSWCLREYARRIATEAERTNGLPEDLCSQAGADADCLAYQRVHLASAGLLSYAAGALAAASAPPQIGSIEWATARLAGRSFPSAGEAADFLNRALDADRAEAAAREAAARLARKHARYLVSFTLEVEVDSSRPSSATVVEAVEAILDGALGPSPTRSIDLSLYDVLDVRARFVEEVTP